MTGYECGDKSSLALTNKHNLVRVDIGLLLEVVNDSLQIALLIKYRHIQRVIITTAIE